MHYDIRTLIFVCLETRSSYAMLSRASGATFDLSRQIGAGASPPRQYHTLSRADDQGVSRSLVLARRANTGDERLTESIRRYEAIYKIESKEYRDIALRNAARESENIVQQCTRKSHDSV